MVDVTLAAAVEGVLPSMPAKALLFVNGTCGPQSPEDQNRLEEKTQGTFPVCVEPKGWRFRDELVNIARKNQGEKQRRNPSDQSPILFGGSQKCRTKGNLDTAGGKNNAVFRSRHPIRHLRLEFLAACAEMADPRPEQEAPEGQPADRPGNSGEAVHGAPCLVRPWTASDSH